MDTPKYYKWSWGIDQRAIIESNLNIDIIDFSILRMLMDFSSSEACQKMQETGTLYYMFRWKLIKSQLPILNLNTRQSVKRRMDKLIASKILAPHPNNQTNRASWFRFAENRDLLFKAKCKQKLPSVNNKLHNVTNYSQKSQQPFTHSDNNRLHDNTINNNTNNNIYREIGGFKIELPQIWPDDVKNAAFEYFEYRAALPKKDRLKTKQGCKGKIKAFSKILDNHSPKILIKAIELTIASEWKDVNIEWLFNKHPQLKTAQPSPEQQTDTYTLPPKLEALYEKGKKDFQKKNLSQRIAYFNKQQFESWMVKGKNFERWRDRGLLPRQIYKKIADTIIYFDTNSFVKKSSGNLQDFVTSAFEGKIKELAK